MNRTELVSIIAENIDVQKKDIELVLDQFALVASECLAKGEKVVITGFGTFEVRNRVARQGRNPRTGSSIDIPALRTPAFKAGKALKEAIRGYSVEDDEE